MDRFAYLHERAPEATGLSEFGDDGYHDGLRRFLDAVDEMAVVGEDIRETASSRRSDRSSVVFTQSLDGRTGPTVAGHRSAARS